MRSSALGHVRPGRTKTFGRGARGGQKPFVHVIEFWVENRLMIEIVSPAMAKEYEDFMKNELSRLTHRIAR